MKILHCIKNFIKEQKVVCSHFQPGTGRTVAIGVEKTIAEVGTFRGFDINKCDTVGGHAAEVDDAVVA